MKNDGLKLLLMFALGAMDDGVCAIGQKDFYARVLAFLMGEESHRKGLEKDALKYLKTAAPFLRGISRRIGKLPLDYETVSVYILGVNNNGIEHLTHNFSNGMSRCAVFGGVVKKVDDDSCQVKTKSSMGYETVKYLKWFISPEDGNKVAFHRGYILCKLTRKQYESLI
jgi:hypothetical protein